MNSPIEKTANQCRSDLETMTGHTRAEVLFAPYRICPIGAHIDHQGGTVLGQAINFGTTLAFAPRSDAAVRLRSRNYDAQVDVSWSEDAPPELSWERYAWAALRALRDLLPDRARGFDGVVSGSLPGGGLSSSASFLLALQTALLRINDIHIDERERVRRSWRAETEFVGLSVGILDPASIVGARRGHMLAINSEQETWETIAPGHLEHEAVFLVCFSGAERELMATGFNERVAQCRQAAARLAELAETSPSENLGDHDDETFLRHADALPGDLRKRASHFFAERQRVADGIDAWREGNLVAFGQAMRDSCTSSIENFEVGSAELIGLQRILDATRGVLGSRFSGGGFAGCILALIESSSAAEVQESVTRAYAKLVPHLAEKSRFFVVESVDGVQLL